MPSVLDPLIALTREPLVTEDVPRIIDAINEGSDIAAAILGGVFVESALRDAIMSRFVQLEPHQQQEITRSGAPLSTFDSAIILGRAVGLYGSNTKHDLTVIRHIRNAFAHGGKPISFTTKAIVDACRTLHCLSFAADALENPQTAREQFSFAVRTLVLHFLTYAESPNRPVHPPGPSLPDGGVLGSLP